MLYEFLTSNRSELIKRCRGKAAMRFGPTEAPTAFEHGVPLFLNQLIETLRVERASTYSPTQDQSMAPSRTEIGRAAALHGAEMLHSGFKIDQVVRTYGDVCQSVTELAVELNVPISTSEFRVFNGCLDNAIADAVVAFGQVNEVSTNEHIKAQKSDLVAFYDEHNRLLDIARLAFSAIKSGDVGITGATSKLLGRTLDELEYLTQRMIPQIRKVNLPSKKITN